MSAVSADWFDAGAFAVGGIDVASGALGGAGTAGAGVAASGDFGCPCATTAGEAGAAQALRDQWIAPFLARDPGTLTGAERALRDELSRTRED